MDSLVSPGLERLAEVADCLLRGSLITEFNAMRLAAYELYGMPAARMPARRASLSG